MSHSDDINRMAAERQLRWKKEQAKSRQPKPKPRKPQESAYTRLMRQDREKREQIQELCEQFYDWVCRHNLRYRALSRNPGWIRAGYWTLAHKQQTHNEGCIMGSECRNPIHVHSNTGGYHPSTIQNDPVRVYTNGRIEIGSISITTITDVKQGIASIVMRTGVPFD